MGGGGSSSSSGTDRGDCKGLQRSCLPIGFMNQELGFKLLAYVDERACRCRASQHLTKDCNVLDLIPGNLSDDVLRSTERKVDDAGDSMSQSMGWTVSQVANWEPKETLLRQSWQIVMKSSCKQWRKLNKVRQTQCCWAQNLPGNAETLLSHG